MHGATRVAVLVTALVIGLAACGSPKDAKPVAANSASARPSGPLGYWTKERIREHFGGDSTASPRVARTAIVAPRVGAVFSGADATGDHFCTGSVIDSPSRDLVMTAAHCLSDGKGGGFRDNIAFAPGYRDGATPYGVWTPKKIVVDDRWKNGADPDYDVAFVTLNPNSRNQNLSDLLGANRLGFDQGFGHPVRVAGYPASHDRPIACIGKSTKQSATQLRFACRGFSGGVSGGPWMSAFDPQSRTGTIIGVIGGYQEGGAKADVSYSPYFGAGVKALYEKAVKG